VNRAGETVHAGQTPVGALGLDRSALPGPALYRRSERQVFTFWAVGKFPTPGKIPNTKMNLAAFDYLRGQTLAKLIDKNGARSAA